jgi:hypothetical protein
MWVSLDPPAGWRRDDAADRRRARPPGGGLWLEWSPLGLLPDDRTPWVGEVLRRDLPDGAALASPRQSTHETSAGWQVLFVEATVEIDGRAVAGRLGAFYGFLEHCGHALVHVDDPAAFAAAEEALRAALLGARPDFGGPLLSVRDFYRGSAIDDDEL